MVNKLNSGMRLDHGEITKVVIAVGIIILIIAISLYYIQIGNTPQPDKLTIIKPSQIYVDQEASLKVGVVNYKGEFIESRNDLIEISILPQGNAMIGVKNDSEIFWSKKLNVQLSKGVVEFWFRDPDVESVTIIARQVEGGTPLDETRTTFIPYH
jgi:hypothetical protein